MSSVDDGGDRRSRILDAAVQVIVDRGVEETRIADVAEAADVSLGLVQYYFRNRQGLLHATLNRAGDRVSATWNDLLDPALDPLLQLADYLRFCAVVDNEPPTVPWSFWVQFWSLADREPRVKATLADIYRSFAERFQRLIEEGVEQGAFAPSQPVGDIVDRLVAVIDGAAISSMIGRLDARRMMSLLVDGLCTELEVDDEQRAAAHRRASRRRRHSRQRA